MTEHRTCAEPALPAGVSHRVCDPATFAYFSHDLRAALADVLGGLQMIPPEAMSPAVQNQIAQVRASGDMLARLMEAGLSVMAGEAELPPAPEPIRTEHLMADISARWEAAAAARGLGFRLTQAADVPPRFCADRIALERVLANLLGNAIRHSRSGTVSCSLDCPQGHLRFAIHNDGPGFPAAVLAQTTPPPAPSQMRHGLGLVIARAMTDRLGGRLSLRNPAGGGAEAVLEMPLTALPDFAALDAPLPDLTGLRVLLAEDSVTGQFVVGRMLAELGVSAELAADGAEALAWLQRAPFDLALIDIEMPRLSGLQVIRALRALPRPAARTPVIVLTAHLHPASLSQITAAGADALLSKLRLDAVTLGQTMAGVLAPAAEPASDPAPFDPARLHHLLQLAGPATARELLTRLDADLAATRTQLARAASGPDWPSLRAQSHVLIALAGTVGADPLHRSAVALNAVAHQRDASSLHGLHRTTLGQLDALIRVLADQAAQ
ncbi:ATP-binding response regulator [Rhodobacter ferrooxidans]|uniref:Histidine kinase n=1 Tax=Rhodobacter ferrooxidans TaxID=371731 RepID=C8S3F4_9RHOB|nr:response regulator [Rhodobacter sp. SW2]EEW24519.1 histidine kinase [Rhodobacter sp. SW2]